MRVAALTLIGSLALTTAAASSNAAPAIPNIGGQPSSNIITVSGGCGPAFHRDAWGYCVANRYYYGSYYGPSYSYRPYYAWGWSHPHWRHW